MRKIIYLILLGIGFNSFSQEILIPIGYVYNQKHNLHLGLDAQLTKETFFIVGISSNNTFNNGKLKSLPEVHASIIPFSSENNNLFLSCFMTEIASTKEYFNPNLGFSIANIIKLKAGYNFSYKSQYQDAKGITFGLIFSLGSMKNFKIM
jgi:hypothetical protein